MSDWDGNIHKLSFSGCGFSGSYHLGVIQCFRDKGKSVLDQVEVFSGCSTGGLCAAIALMECPVVDALSLMRQMTREVQSSFLKIFNPSFQFEKILRDQIDFMFPENAHELANERLHLSATDFWALKNTVISQYETRDEFINALMASCYVPGYMGRTLPNYRGKVYVDGGMTNNLLYADDLGTLTISPLKGEFDICPTDPYDGSYNLGSFSLSGHKLDFSLFNLQKLYRVFIPKSESDIDELFKEGYRDAHLFLYKQKFTEEYSADQPITIPRHPQHLPAHGLP